MEKSKILLVDDEKNTLVSMSDILRDHYHVVVAEDGVKGLEAFRSGGADLVIADQRMPGMSGVELLSRMKADNADCIRMILTAHADFDTVVDAVNGGEIYRFVIKPWQPDDMLQTIRQALEHLEADRARRRLLAELQRKNTLLEKTAADLRKAQAALVRSEKLATVGTLAGTIVHEIGNQLFVAYSADALKKRYANDRELSEFLDSVASLGDTVSSMLDGYRFYVRGGSIGFKIEKGDAFDLASQVVAAARRTAFGQDRRIVVRGTGPVECRFDKPKLRQVLVNLVRNACQATSEGGTVEVNCFIDNADAIISVADNGCGIEPQFVERIWEPFFSTRPDQGLGLGLALSRSFIEGQRGTIKCIPSPTSGATFVVRLPVAEG